MSENPNSNNPGNSPVPPVSTPPVTPGTVVDPGKQTDWEQMYKGLQATYNKLFTANDELQKKHIVLNTEHEQTKQDLAKALNDLATATKSLGEKDGTLLEKQTDVEKTKASLARFKLIAGKFPMLIKMESEGLIPDVKPEELEAKLTAIQASILSAIDDKTKQTLQNTPPGPIMANNNLPPAMTEDEIWAKITVLAGSKDPAELAEYERLYKLYLELTSAPKK